MDFFGSNQQDNTQRVSIVIELTKVKNRTYTLVKNLNYTIDSTVSAEKEMLRKLKKDICSTGGFMKDGYYALQGNCIQVIREYLASVHLKDDEITVIGIA